MTEKYALVIGINKYSEPDLNDLTTPARNAELLAKKLELNNNFHVTRFPKTWIRDEDRKEGGYSEVASGGSDLSNEEKPTSNNLGRVLREFFNRAKENDALIYFSGHGLMITDDLEEKKGYLAASNSRSDGSNAISLSSLNQLVHRSQVKNLLILLDCCHAGFLAEEFPEFGTTTSYSIIAACRSFEKAYEVPGEHSVFAQALLEGLSAKQTNSNTITSYDICKYIKDSLKRTGQEAIWIPAKSHFDIIRCESLSPLKANKNITCPYPELRSFNRSETLFGRKKLIEEAREKLRQTNFLIVLGPSGSGKTSLIEAGLIPCLDKEEWSVPERILPGENPSELLEQTLNNFKASDHENQQPSNLIIEEFNLESSKSTRTKKLIIFDQFEQIFTHCKDEENRQKFIEKIVHIIQQRSNLITILIIIRSDFLASFIDGFRSIGEFNSIGFSFQGEDNFQGGDNFIVCDFLYDRSEFRRVVKQPIASLGFDFENGLEDELLSDQEDQSHCFPFIQLVLNKIWHQNDKDKSFTRSKYFALGRLFSVIASYAEQEINTISNHLQDENKINCIKNIFLGLVQRGSDGKDAPRERSKRKLFESVSAITNIALGSVESTFEQLVESRLIIAGQTLVLDDKTYKLEGEPWVKLAHGSLLSSWERYGEWLGENPELRQKVSEIDLAIAIWSKNGNGDEYLRPDLVANLSEGMWEEIKLRLEMDNSFADNFYKLSRKPKIDLQRITELNSQVFEVKHLLVSSQSTSRVTALILAVKTLGDFLRTMEEQYGGLSLVSQEPALSMLFIEIQSALHETIAKSVEKSILHGHNNYVLSTAFSPKGDLILSGGADNIIKLWDQRGRLIKSLEGHHKSITKVVFSPDGKLFASGSDDGIILIWNKEGNIILRLQIGRPEPAKKVILNFSRISGNHYYTLIAARETSVSVWKLCQCSEDLRSEVIYSTERWHDEDINSIIFSNDGEKVLSCSADGKMKLKDKQGQLILDFPQQEGYLNSATFSPDDKYIASAGITVRLWDSKGNLVVRDFEGYQEPVNEIIFSPNGRVIAGCTKYADETDSPHAVRLWDLQGKAISILKGHREWVNEIDFSLDGDSIVSCSADHDLRLWDLQGNLVCPPLKGHKNWVMSVAFSPTDDIFASASADGSIRLWDLEGNLIAGPFEGHENWVTSVAFSPDGDSIVSGSADGTLRLWNLRGEQLGTPFRGHSSGITSVNFSPQSAIISGSYDATVRLWDPKNPRNNNAFHRDHTSPINTVCFSPDGKCFASGSYSGLRLTDQWDNPLRTSEGITISPFRNSAYGITSSVFSPDGHYVVVGRFDGTIGLGSLQDGTSSTYPAHSKCITSIAFSPDGQYLVSGSRDKTIRLWYLANSDSKGELKSIGAPFQHASAVTSVVFSRDGRYIISGSEDGTIGVWHGHWSGWLKVACNRLHFHPAFNKQSKHSNTLAACQVCEKYSRVFPTPEI
jgi:WD40 repeat protein